MGKEPRKNSIFILLNLQITYLIYTKVDEGEKMCIHRLGMRAAAVQVKLNEEDIVRGIQGCLTL